MTTINKEKTMEKLMVWEELTRGTGAHWGIEKAVEVVESMPEENPDEDDKK